MATNDEHVIQYKGDHEGRVLTKLNRLRKRKVFTDVTFKLEDGEVSAQKIILAGYSDYYEKMFTSGVMYQLIFIETIPLIILIC
ncbi:kelch-like protein 12 [Ciona intestinalis]